MKTIQECLCEAFARKAEAICLILALKPGFLSKSFGYIIEIGIGSLGVLIQHKPSFDSMKQSISNIETILLVFMIFLFVVRYILFIYT